MFRRLSESISHRTEKKLRAALAAQAVAADKSRMLLGLLHAERVRQLPDHAALQEAEFSVYSQWGEDGIIEYLVSRLERPVPRFVEFGVQDYTESNTRFLLKHRNWSGLVIDGSEADVARIRADALYWRYDLRALNAFVTAENIDDLLAANGFEGEIGVLSVDIDGNDYWVWKAMARVQPQIVVCEYNSVFGNRHAITIPYDPAFARTRAHASNLYFGASLPALVELGSSKGYVFAGCDSAGANAYFVRRDCAARVRERSVEEGYVESRARESRDAAGRLTFVSGPARAQQIGDCVVHDLRRSADLPLRTLQPL